jgi:Xaa-Pro aminopeptidase
VTTSHFQSFDDPSSSAESAHRCDALRARLRALELDGFLVPRADRHQNEYVAPGDERLAWLSGFTGSAGLGIVLLDRAALFVDGRYTIAVREQIDPTVFTPVALAETSPEAWLRANLSTGARLGFDSWLHTPAQIDRLATSGVTLVPLDDNPIDAIWADRPAPPCGKIVEQPLPFAGEEATHKLARIAESLKDADALLLSDPHAVAWAFNIRGSDVAHTPLPLAFALIRRGERPILYVQTAKLAGAIAAIVAEHAEIAPPERVTSDLEARGRAGETILFDAATVPIRLTGAFAAAGGKPRIGADPVGLMKARKNAAEQHGARQAHLRDGIAVTRFLHWLDGAARKGHETEISAAKKLEAFRQATGKLKDLSFPSISAAGPHAAIPHYRVLNTSNLPIARGLFLIDSGGQYEDGTTDITRTIAVGRPDRAMRACFTLVLKGHIAIARAVFPKGTSGAQIDGFARHALWQAGLDFDHGTGHGVGSYLSVHEGPQRISKLGHVALEPGMILSNEPGYYREGHWGIRIENLVLVEPRKIAGAEREMYGFETLTLAPFDRSLIQTDLLDSGEIAWLDAYHARVHRALSQHVEPAVTAWLTKATAPLIQPAT